VPCRNKNNGIILASFDAHGRDGKLLNLLGAVPPKCCLSRI
jgi:hypothetical protein